MNDDRTHLDDIPTLGKSVEDVEKESGRTAKEGEEGTSEGIVVPPLYSAMGGGGVGVPAPGAPVVPIVPTADDRPDDAKGVPFAPTAAPDADEETAPTQTQRSEDHDEPR